MSAANETQIGGRHYASEYQHWDYVQDTLEGRYLEGVFSKYIVRWRRKGGETDLRKAMHVLEKLTEEAETGRISPMQVSTSFSSRVLVNSTQFAQANALSSEEEGILRAVATWGTSTDLRALQDRVAKFVQKVTEEGAPTSAYVDQDR